MCQAGSHGRGSVEFRPGLFWPSNWDTGHLTLKGNWVDMELGCKSESHVSTEWGSQCRCASVQNEQPQLADWRVACCPS